jgi:hypothetical protein
VADLLHGRSRDADFRTGDPYFHSHLWRNPAMLRPQYYFPNYGDASSEIVWVKQGSSLCSKTRNFANYSFVRSEFFIL